MDGIRPVSRHGSRRPPLIPTHDLEISSENRIHDYRQESGSLPGTPDRPTSRRSWSMSEASHSPPITPPVSPHYNTPSPHTASPTSTAAGSRPRASRPKSAKGRNRPSSSLGNHPPIPVQHLHHSPSSTPSPDILGRSPPIRPGSSMLTKYRILPGISRADSEPLTATTTSQVSSWGENDIHLEKVRGGNLLEHDISSIMHATAAVGLDCPTYEQHLITDGREGHKADQSSNGPSTANPAKEPLKRKISRSEIRSKQAQRRLLRSRSVLVPDEPKESQERVNLAIRLPAGERHERYFSPENTLQEVLAYAELQAGHTLENCELSTNVPRRVFKDLSQTISEVHLQDRTMLYLQENG